MRQIGITLAVALVIALCVISASAQPLISAKSGVISWVQGKAFLGDQLLEPSLTKFPDIKENAIVRTEQGLVEVLLTPGTTLHVGENSSFRLITNRLIDTRLELLTGSAVLDAIEIAKDTSVTMVVKDGTVQLTKAGHYRFDTDPARIKVFEGVADVQMAGQHVAVSAGKMLSLSGVLASVEKFDKEVTDDLDNWAGQRCSAMALANVSAARSAYNSYAPMSAGSSAGTWGWNPYFGMYTYLPYSGHFCDPYYGYCYWSPGAVNRLYYQPTINYNNAGYGGGSGSVGGFNSVAATSSGYSGAMSSGVSVGASPSAAASSGSSTGASAGAASAGHGGGAGGGHGH